MGGKHPCDELAKMCSGKPTAADSRYIPRLRSIFEVRASSREARAYEALFEYAAVLPPVDT